MYIKSKDTKVKFFRSEMLYVAVHLSKLDRDIPFTSLFGGFPPIQYYKEDRNSEFE